MEEEELLTANGRELERGESVVASLGERRCGREDFTATSFAEATEGQEGAEVAKGDAKPGRWG
jgi:hypothetical protein